jgi:predicted ATPase
MVLLDLGRRDEADARLRQALTIARQQNARWWELRAAMSLARQWQTEGKPAEAYLLLEPVYRGFTEGFETDELRDAKALLDSLSGPWSPTESGQAHVIASSKNQV